MHRPQIVVPPQPPQPRAPLTRGPDGTYSYAHRELLPRHRPVMTYVLLGLCVLVLLAQLADPAITNAFAVIPKAVLAGDWWLIVTGAFVHAGVLHVGMNVLFGFGVGANLERHIGPWRLLLVSVVAMIGAGIAIVLRGQVTVGFSGVLYGWLAAWLAFHLTTRFPGLRLSGPQRRAYLKMLVANLAISLLPFVSLAGHAGGFVSGFAIALLLGLRFERPAAQENGAQ